MPWQGRLGKADAKLSLGGNGFSSRDLAVSLGSDFKLDSTPATAALDNVFAGRRVGSAVDLQWQVGRFEVWVEKLRVRFEPDDDLPASEFRSDGWYGQAAVYLISKRLQAVVKYEEFDPNDKVEDDQTSTWTVGANLLFKGDDIKIQGHYARFDGGGAPDGPGSRVMVRLQTIF